MRNLRVEIYFAAIYVLLFIVLFNLTLDNPLLEYFRNHYWIIVLALSIVFPLLKFKILDTRAVIVNYAILLALTMIPEWAGNAVYYFFISSSRKTVFDFQILTAIYLTMLTAGYITGALIKMVFIYFGIYKR
jgi:hypothetical protein